MNALRTRKVSCVKNDGVRSIYGNWGEIVQASPMNAMKLQYLRWNHCRDDCQ